MNDKSLTIETMATQVDSTVDELTTTVRNSGHLFIPRVTRPLATPPAPCPLAAPAPRPVSTVVPKREGAPYLKLVPRDERAAEIEKLEAKITAAIGKPTTQHYVEPHTVPMPRGELQRFDGFSEDTQVVFRYKTLRHGRPLLFSVPGEYCTPEMAALISECVDIAETEEETR